MVAFRIQRQNVILAIAVAVAAVLLFLWGCPYLWVTGHGRWCTALYILLLAVYVFGRGFTGRRRDDAPNRQL